MVRIISTVIPCCLSAYAMIYAGLAFQNGRFLPRTLSGVYAHTGWLSRILIMAALCNIPANLLVARCFGGTSAGLMISCLLGTEIVIACINAALLDGSIPVRALLPGMAAIACLVWFGYEVGEAS